ncbi:MAG: TetR/AcrR family transcriptional regulator [Methanobacteriaceae archaeon]|jgi:AcrR family transcriptional regulator|nr:MAG: TetR family transcriptional regulator [Methanobacterium sp. BRmetb2]MCC7558766.1 TetR/AcrR family transcriptional regulator [Methanobacteriaceae archaeon]
MTIKKSREKRIEEITQAAVDEFLEKGYENTSMEAIAQRAGVSKGGLYYHFKSKDLILMFVNEKISKNIEKIMVQALKSGSVKERLLFFIENYLNYWINHPQEFTIIFLSVAKILDKPELLGYYQRFTRDYFKYFEEMFSCGVQSGEFKSHNTRTSALTLVAALDGILSYMIVDDNLKLEDVIPHFEDKFIKPIEIGIKIS